MVHVLRTTDRKIFKECRRQWNYTSKIRNDYGPIRTNKNLEFGIAIHRGLEVYYDPEKWSSYPVEARRSLAIAAFIEENRRQLKQAEKFGFTDVLTDEDYAERAKLGVGMLQTYFDWAEVEDHKVNLVPLATELEFEVPVLVPQGVDLVTLQSSQGTWVIPHARGFTAEEKESGLHLYYKDEPVVYQGRIDLILRAEIDGAEEYWILDHKTAAKFDESMPELDVDTQVTSYAWAAQFFFPHKISGVIYQQIKKAVPEMPKLVYKGKALSKDKSQSTTYEMYMAAIHEHGFDPADYDDMLTYLSAKEETGSQFVRRLEQRRSQAELDNQGLMIYDEAIDMLGDPRIYPNPTYMNCRRCPFYGPCLVANENPGAQEDIELLAMSSDFVKGGTY